MKNIFKNKRNILIMMFALVVIMGIGFAAYSQQLKINETSSIDSNWDVYIKSVDAKSTKGGATGHGTVDSKTAASLTTDLKYPCDNVIYNITVANDGSIDAILEKINFNMEKENTVIKYYYSVDDEATWNEVTKASENPYDVDLLANTTDEFQVKVEYDPTKTGTATEEQKSNKLTLNLDYVQKTGGGAVVPSGPLAAETLKEKVTTTGDGLYADEYEEGRYIYKGANPNNYITFNNETWRILSVENDGTLKIMKATSIGNIAWDTSKSNNWAKPATLNTYLNDENDSNSYYNSLSSESQSLIQSHSWAIGSVTYGNSDLAAQIQTENGTTWNGKIGLMTVSEFLRSNTNTSQCGNYNLNQSNFFSICSKTNYIIPPSEYLWTISPLAGNSNSVLSVYSFGNVTDYAADLGVLPALYLTSNISLNGEGTSSNPYTIIS